MAKRTKGVKRKVGKGAQSRDTSLIQRAFGPVADEFGKAAAPLGAAAGDVFNALG
jgi:hypothetical protein